VFNYLPCIEGCVDCKTLVAAQTKVSNAVQSMLAGKRQSFSIEYPCAFGTDTRWFSLRIDRFKGSALLWLIITHEEITERKLAAEELSRVATNFKKMLRKVELAHEEDSKQIAREIHDQLGATLTMLKLGLATSKGNQEVPDTLHSKFDGMIDLADQALQSVKRVTAQLRPSMLDTLGLVAALKWHVKEFSRMTSIAAEIQVPDYIKLSPERGNAVFRIIQESLTNIAKHAHASKVNILARKTKRDLIFVVNDNGVGLQAKQSTRRDSFGVIGMQERAIYLGGNLTLESLPEGGVSMTLQIPMEIKAPKQAEDLFS
jgi:signal transduction histidine kinase